MTTNQTISFPRELSDELGELIAEKARVCGGGAFDIWEAICDQFGTPAAKPQGEPDVAKCNEDVYKNGESLGLYDMPKEEAEARCIQLTKETGRLHDWHYIAGRVHIKALPAEQPAPVAVVLPERLLGDDGVCTESHYASGWNAYDDELKRLNPSL